MKQTVILENWTGAYGTWVDSRLNHYICHRAIGLSLGHTPRQAVITTSRRRVDETSIRLQRHSFRGYYKVTDKKDQKIFESILLADYTGYLFEELRVMFQDTVGDDPIVYLTIKEYHETTN